MKTTAVIMAGGRGERFWPKSRKSLPKQFLSLTNDGKTMIQLTAERHLPIVAYEDMFVVTNADYVGLVKEQLPKIPAENILAEPCSRNTAPCVGFAAAVIQKKYGDAVMLVLASDHLIKNTKLYIDTMEKAVHIAEDHENIVTLGITPTFPETGYGYIEFGESDENSAHSGAYTVKRFVEKPDYETAKAYLKSGEYLWNSGMFIWKVSTILKNFEKFMPQTYEGLLKIGAAFGENSFDETLSTCFSGFESVSVDYGIMEHADCVYTIPGNFGWDDVGSWLALERINQPDSGGNVLFGDIAAINTRNTIIVGDKKLITAIGVEDLIVVDTGDATLVCHKEHTADVKKIIEILKSQSRDELL